MTSPDILDQNPYSTQSYNRYSYVTNNPLKYVDPSGYISGYYAYFERQYVYLDEDKVGCVEVTRWSLWVDGEEDGDENIYGSSGGFGGSRLIRNDYVSGGGYSGRSRASIIKKKYEKNKKENTGVGNGSNGRITLNEASISVSAISLSNSIKANLMEWGMQGANWGKVGAKYMKVVRGTGIAGSVFGMSVSGYHIYNDYSQGGINAINGLDVADFGVGAVGLGATIFLASNPVGWAIVGGTTIYFGSRFIYDISTKP